MCAGRTGCRRLFLLALAFEGSLGLGAWGAAGWLGLELPLFWNLKHALLGLGAVVPPLGCFLVLRRSSWPPCRRLRELADNFLLPLFAPCHGYQLALLSLAAGWGEELLFRGLAQTLASEHLGVGWGLAAVSLVFGLLHALTPLYALLASFMSIYLGIIQLSTGNLLAAILAHAGYDFAFLIYLTRLAPPPRSAPAALVVADTAQTPAPPAETPPAD
jgi:membrane protease YdiL (CAAX protease family)